MAEAMAEIMVAQYIAAVAYFDVDSKYNFRNNWQAVEQAGEIVSFSVVDPSMLSPTNFDKLKCRLRFCREDYKQKVLGYVSTSGGRRPLEPVVSSDGTADRSTIYGQVKWWYDHFKGYTDGVFFDEGPSYPQDKFGVDHYKDRQDFYSKLCADFKANRIPDVDLGGSNYAVGINATLYPGHVTTDDPANYPQDWILHVADFIVVWEEPVLKKEEPSKGLELYKDAFLAAKDPQWRMMNPPSWWTDPANTQKIVHVIWDCPNPDKMMEIVQMSKGVGRNAGHIYVYDGNSGCSPTEACPDPKDPLGHPRGGYWRLPTFWDQEMQVVSPTNPQALASQKEVGL